MTGTETPLSGIRRSSAENDWGRGGCAAYHRTHAEL